MKSFADRADRGLHKTDVNSSLHSQAYLLQQAGKNEEALQLYATIYQKNVASLLRPSTINYDNIATTATINTTNTATTATSEPNFDILDTTTADYCQLLEICCAHNQAIQILKSTLEHYEDVLPVPCVCSLLLLKILYTHPEARSELQWEEMKILCSKINNAVVNNKNHAKSLRRRYKSSWSYYTIISELFRRERRLKHRFRMQPVLTDSNPNPTISPSPSSSLFVVGDSHCVSLAHRLIQGRVATPWIITGLKAWHVHRGKSFFTGANFLKAFHCISKRMEGERNLSRRYDIIVSAGEIDCREGFQNVIRSFGSDDQDRSKELYVDEAEAVKVTVDKYVTSLSNILRNLNNTILYILPIYPYQKKSKNSSGQNERERRRSCIYNWNQQLKKRISEEKTTNCSKVGDSSSCGGGSVGFSGCIGMSNGNENKMVYLELNELCDGGPLPDYLSLDGIHVNAKIVSFVENAMNGTCQQETEMEGGRVEQSNTIDTFQ